jgi:hypothetical protein
VAAVLGALGYEVTVARRRAAQVINLEAEKAQRARARRMKKRA